MVRTTGRIIGIGATLLCLWATAGFAQSFPEGETTLNETIVLGTGAVLSGAGREETILLAGSSLTEMVRNADDTAGNSGITIRDLTLDCGNRAGFGIRLTRASRLRLENVRVTNCRRNGMKISGGGMPTRRFTLTGIEATNNGEDGIIVQWAMRDGIYSDIYAEANGRHGITFDHSEFTAANIVTRDNRRSGIFLRNLFATTLSGLTATHNGEHGILVQGWVHSVGSAWRAQGNSQNASGAFDDIHFSGDASLSYGVTRRASLTGVITGDFQNLGATGLARHGIFLEEGVGLVVLDALSFGATEEEPLRCDSAATAENLVFPD
jgi:hypothetical protein